MRYAGIAVDLGAVLLFVGIGRAAHSDGTSFTGMLSTVWPFAAGLAVGWLGVIASRRSGLSMGAGLSVWASTVAFGMVLRVASGQGIAVAFVFVALGFLGAAMFGWRVLLRCLRVTPAQ